MVINLIYNKKCPDLKQNIFSIKLKKKSNFLLISYHIKRLRCIKRIFLFSSNIFLENHVSSSEVLKTGNYTTIELKFEIHTMSSVYIVNIIQSHALRFRTTQSIRG